MGTIVRRTSYPVDYRIKESKFSNWFHTSIRATTRVAGSILLETFRYSSYRLLAMETTSSQRRLFFLRPPATTTPNNHDESPKSTVENLKLTDPQDLYPDHPVTYSPAAIQIRCGPIQCFVTTRKWGKKPARRIVFLQETQVGSLRHEPAELNKLPQQRTECRSDIEGAMQEPFCMASFISMYKQTLDRIR